MSNTNIKIGPPSKPDLSMAPTYYDVPIETLGLRAVNNAQAQVHNVLAGDYHNQKHLYAQELESKWGPEKGRVIYKAGRLIGKSLTDKEIEFLDEYAAEKEATDWHVNYFENNAKNYGESTTIVLDGVRGILGGLDRNQAVVVNDYFEKDTPDFLYNLRGETVEDVDKNNWDWVEWLTKQATDEQLLNVFQWHIHTIEQQQTSQETAEVIEENKKDYKDALALGIKAGWLHPESQTGVDKVDKIQVLIGDVFDTIAQERAGYHWMGTETVVIAQGTGSSEPSRRQHRLNRLLDQHLKHELNHAVLGLKPEERWLNEALTEHIAQVFDHGEFENIAPDVRVKMGVYREERALLDTLVNYGSVPIDLSLFTRYYSARSDVEAVKTYDELASALEKAWGNEDLLDEIANYLSFYENKLHAAGELTERQTQDRALQLVRSDLLQQPHFLNASRKKVAA